MVICFECSPEIKRQLDRLVLGGQFTDYSEAIAAAIANQAVLTDRVARGGNLVLTREAIIHEATPSGRYAKGSPSTNDATGLSTFRSHLLSVPPRFAIDGLAGAALEPTKVPDDAGARRNTVPASQWLWGQFNRFLPAKASCRALARLIIDAGSGVRLTEAASRIAEQAVELGDYLVLFDRSHSLKREDSTATAFPHSGPDVAKARERYAAQFVGSVNGKGKASGMLTDLKLISADSTNGDLTVRLTEAGWRLAQFPNPVLDDASPRSSDRFSREEVDFLLDHISRSVRVEDFAYRFLMQAIEAGSKTPEALDNAVDSANTGMSRAFISTQRSGVVARMADLGLIARSRSGLNVTYIVTDNGRTYVDRQ